MSFATWMSPCLQGKLQNLVFCYIDVAVSIGEAAKPRVFCCVDVAVSIGEAAGPRIFCWVDVAVSTGEVVSASFVVYGITGNDFV